MYATNKVIPQCLDKNANVCLGFSLFSFALHENEQLSMSLVMRDSRSLLLIYLEIYTF